MVLKDVALFYNVVDFNKKKSDFQTATNIDSRDRPSEPKTNCVSMEGQQQITFFL